MARHGRGGTVLLDPSRGPSLTLILNKEPDRAGGVGGWENVERSLRRDAKWWKSIPVDTMTLDCTLDIDAIDGPSIERRLRQLRDMGQADDADDPPTIRVRGDVWSKDRHIHWVMDNWTLGPRLYRRNGELRRQQVSLELSRYTDLNEIRPLRIRSTRTKKGKKRRTRTVTARHGETLRGLALRELGNAGRWRDLRTWNKKLHRIDPDQAIRTGTHVKIKG